MLQGRVTKHLGNNMDAMYFSYCRCDRKDETENCVQAGRNIDHDSEPVPDHAAHVSTYAESAGVDPVAPKDRGFKMFKNSVAVPVHHTTLVYRPLFSEHAMSGKILYLVRLDAWIDISDRCLNVHDRCGGHVQKLFADKFSKMLPKATEQIIGSIR